MFPKVPNAIWAPPMLLQTSLCSSIRNILGTIWEAASQAQLTFVELLYAFVPKTSTWAAANGCSSFCATAVAAFKPEDSIDNWVGHVLVMVLWLWPTPDSALVTPGVYLCCSKVQLSSFHSLFCYRQELEASWDLKEFKVPTGQLECPEFQDIQANLAYKEYRESLGSLGSLVLQ